jgi:hypothetical protein
MLLSQILNHYFFCSCCIFRELSINRFLIALKFFEVREQKHHSSKILCRATEIDMGEILQLFFQPCTFVDVCMQGLSDCI